MRPMREGIRKANIVLSSRQVLLRERSSISLSDTVLFSQSKIEGEHENAHHEPQAAKYPGKKLLCGNANEDLILFA